MNPMTDVPSHISLIKQHPGAFKTVPHSPGMDIQEHAYPQLLEYISRLRYTCEMQLPQFAESRKTFTSSCLDIFVSVPQSTGPVDEKCVRLELNNSIVSPVHHSPPKVLISIVDTELMRTFTQQDFSFAEFVQKNGLQNFTTGNLDTHFIL